MGNCVLQGREDAVQRHQRRQDSGLGWPAKHARQPGPQPPHDALDRALDPRRLTILQHRNNTLSLWDPERFGHCGTPPVCGPTPSPALSPDGRHLAFATREGPLYLWDVETERPIACLEGWQGGRSTVGFSPRGKLLAAVAPAKGLKLWNLDPLEELAILPKSEAAPARNLYFAADDQAVAAGSTAGTVESGSPTKKSTAWESHQDG